MTNRDQRHALSASFGAQLTHGLAALGLRLRLMGELSVGGVARCCETTGKLLLTSPVNLQS